MISAVNREYGAVVESYANGRSVNDHILSRFAYSTCCMIPHGALRHRFQTIHLLFLHSDFSIKNNCFCEKYGGKEAPAMIGLISIYDADKKTAVTRVGNHYFWTV